MEREGTMWFAPNRPINRVGAPIYQSKVSGNIGQSLSIGALHSALIDDLLRWARERSSLQCVSLFILARQQEGV